jgi:hypothetical protein
VNQYFNIFNQYEKPELFLCNPAKSPLYSLGLAYNVKESIRYNAMSELSFTYAQSKDAGQTIDPVYAYIQGKLVVAVTIAGGGL